jgi:hypothetical protein
LLYEGEQVWRDGEIRDKVWAVVTKHKNGIESLMWYFDEKNYQNAISKNVSASEGSGEVRDMISFGVTLFYGIIFLKLYDIKMTLMQANEKQSPEVRIFI